MSQMEPDSFDPRGRRLCPDGACVGLIGSDGRCRVCGAVDPEGPADRLGPGLSAAAFSGGCATEEDEAEAAGGDPSAAYGDLDGEPAFDPGRGLCPDGGCLGVLGPDRRCKVCGRGAEA